MTGDSRHGRHFFLAAISALALLTLLSTVQLSLIDLRVGNRPDYLNHLVLNLLFWLPWIPLATLLLRFIGKNPLDPKRWHFALPLHVAAMFAFSLLHDIFAHGLYLLLYHFDAADIPRFFLTMWIKTLHINLLVYAAILSLGYMWEYYRKNQISRLKASMLEARLAEARLEALRNRLNPHFLFNTLHTVLALVRKDPKTAEGMLAGLSDLLRKALDTSDLEEVTLKEEIELLTLYLNIQQIRFRDRLHIESLIDPDTLGMPVPKLILQPLVENAIQHGIALRAGGGHLAISTEKEGGRLILKIQDSGPGFPKDGPEAPEAGFGLANTKARLDLHFGPHYSLRFENRPEGGAVVTLELPAPGTRAEEPLL